MGVCMQGAAKCLQEYRIKSPLMDICVSVVMESLVPIAIDGRPYVGRNRMPPQPLMMIAIDGRLHIGISRASMQPSKLIAIGGRLRASSSRMFMWPSKPFDIDGRLHTWSSKNHLWPSKPIAIDGYPLRGAAGRLSSYQSRLSSMEVGAQAAAGHPRHSH